LTKHYWPNFCWPSIIGQMPVDQTLLDKWLLTKHCISQMSVDQTLLAKWLLTKHCIGQMSVGQTLLPKCRWPNITGQIAVDQILYRANVCYSIIVLAKCLLTKHWIGQMSVDQTLNWPNVFRQNVFRLKDVASCIFDCKRKWLWVEMWPQYLPVWLNLDVIFFWAGKAFRGQTL
jgi:hypothetical protein